MSSQEEQESGSDYEDEMEEDMDAEMEAGPEPTGGYTSAGSTGDEEDCDDFFGGDMSPMQMLEMLNAQQPGDGKQPFQIARERRRARRHARAAEADSEEEEEGQAQQQQQQGAEAAAAAGQQLLRRRGRRRRGRRRGTRGVPALPEDVEKMIGQATLLYATQDIEKAEDILMEVIRQVPNLIEPWITLGQMFENTGDKRKALNYYMIAGIISPKRMHESDMWVKMGDMSMELGFVSQAVTLYQAALRRHRNDPGILLKRAEAFVELGEVSRAIQDYKKVQQQAPADPEVVRRLVQLHHGQNDLLSGIRLLEEFMRDHSAATNLTLVNMLAELYITRGDFKQGLKLIQRAEEVLCVEQPLPIDLVIKQGTCLVHTGHPEEGLAEWSKLLDFDPVNEEGDFSDLYNTVVNVCASLALHDAALPFVTALVDSPGLEPSSSELALYCSCYRQAGRPDLATALYEKRLMAIGVHHPSYLEIALSYVDLQAGTGHREMARQLLDQIDAAIEGHQLTLSEDRAEQVELFLRKVQLHLTLGNRGKYLEASLPLLTEALEVGEATADQLRQAAEAQHKGQIPKDILKALQRRVAFARKGGRRGAAAAASAAEASAVFKGYTSRDRRKPHVAAADEEAARLLAAGAAAGPLGALAEAEGKGDASRDLLGNDALFEAFLVMVQALVAAGRLDEAKELLTRAVGLVNQHLAMVKLSKLSSLGEGKGLLQARRDGLKLLECYIWVEAGDKAKALKELKPLLKRWTCSWAVWGLFAVLAPSQLPSRQWLRDVATTATKHSTSAPLALLATHGALLGEQYHDATSGYAALLSALPNEPLLLLCLGAAQLDLAVSQRVTSVDRNTAALRGFAALHSYAAFRPNKIEAAYNLGRGAHLLGLNHVAIAYYESMLQQAEASIVQEPSPASSARTLGMSLVSLGKASTVQGGTVGGSGYSLVKEAAWNLSLLYKASGAEQLARQLMRRYLTY